MTSYLGPWIAFETAKPSPVLTLSNRYIQYQFDETFCNDSFSGKSSAGDVEGTTIQKLHWPCGLVILSRMMAAADSRSQTGRRGDIDIDDILKRSISLK